MDSTARPTSSLFSPSLTKSIRQQPTPRKSTPSRRYLRQSFPNFGSPSTTPQFSPGDAFKQRQQLPDAMDEDPLHLPGMHIDKEAPLEQEDDDASSMSSILQHPGETQTSATDATAIMDPQPGSALHAKQAQDLSDRLTKLLEKTTTRRAHMAAARNGTSNPSGSTGPRLRTTETEYDLSPDRSARLSTPPHSLYSGTPSQRHPRLQEMGECDDFTPSPVSVSPSVRHARSRQWLEHERIMKHNKALFKRHANSLKDELASAAERMSREKSLTDHVIGEQELEQGKGQELKLGQGQEQEQEPEQEDRDHSMSTQVDTNEHGLDPQHETPVPENAVYDDQGYELVDEEVSFKRPQLVTSSFRSTLVDPDILLGDDLEDRVEGHSSTLPPTPRLPVKQNYPPTPRVSVRQTHLPTPHVQPQQAESSWMSTPKRGGLSPGSENTLLEVAKKTAAITEELRGVYSNLQELFSPETEAKLSGAMSVLSAHKTGSGSRASKTRRLFNVEAIPNPVFEASLPAPAPPQPQLPMTPKTPSIIKRKPAPLRPAVISKAHRTPLSEQQQTHSSQTLKEQSNREYEHDIRVRSLISNAESARRLYQSSNDAPLSGSVNGTQEFRSPHRVPHTLGSEAGNPRERHQERFRRKLDVWKRIERRSKCAPLPTYTSLYVPTSTSRPIRAELSGQTIKQDQHLDNGTGNGYGYDHHEDFEEEWEEEGEGGEEQYAKDEVLELYEPKLAGRDNAYRERILEDVRAQLARDEELRQRRSRQSEGFESDEELLNHRLSKRRREAYVS
ncbi:MAG: hypothetical protein J3Q66DRAFT_346066 [Benniella sp.]|nr:MAG: hypothetical protein J3Q66DRAFT_346066 [Benniella sp.]